MKKLAIGVDIGGINTAFGLVDENGDLYAESVISTKKYPCLLYTSPSPRDCS